MSEKKHGGARHGAGRPKLDTGGTKDRRVSLDDQTVEIMRKIGSGNLSKGIRLAAAKISTESQLR